MFVVGLTGPIASGKTTAATYLQEKGIGIINADAISKALTRPQQSAYQSILKQFGPGIIKPNGELDRLKLRKLIFSDIKKRTWLETLLHPLIAQEIKKQIDQNDQPYPYMVVEIPLPPRPKQYPYLNRILAIISEPQRRIARVQARDHHSLALALAMIDNQATNDSYMACADDIIFNNEDKPSFFKNLEKLHQQYLQLAHEKSL